MKIAVRRSLVTPSHIGYFGNCVTDALVSPGMDDALIVAPLHFILSDGFSTLNIIIGGLGATQRRPAVGCAVIPSTGRSFMVTCIVTPLYPRFVCFLFLCHAFSSA